MKRIYFSQYYYYLFLITLFFSSSQFPNWLAQWNPAFQQCLWVDLPLASKKKIDPWKFWPNNIRDFISLSLLSFSSPSTKWAISAVTMKSCLWAMPLLWIHVGIPLANLPAIQIIKSLYATQLSATYHLRVLTLFFSKSFSSPSFGNLGEQNWIYSA